MLKYALCTLALVVVTAVHAADEKKATDPVSGKAADRTISTTHNGGKVYFESKDTLETFTKNKAKYSAKANFQLFQTSQVEQIKCPLTGRDLNPEKTAKIEGVAVNVCCGNCEANMAKLKGDDLVNKLFADAAFKKGFKAK